MMAAQTEIRDAGDVLDDSGALRVHGYSRRPVLAYNPEKVRFAGSTVLGRLRLKEWDYYGITTPRFFFSAGISHAGYVGVAFAYLIDFDERVQWEDTIVTPLGAGCRLPHSSGQGDVVFERKGARIAFLRSPGMRRVEVNWPSFGKGRGLDSEWEISQGNEIDSIVMATPMPGRCFYYNEKINAMPSVGSAHFDGREYAAADGLAVLDWGRGVWPYRTFWNWASASGRLDDGRRIGLNLGCGFGDLSAATENCIFIEGAIHKLGGVSFDYDPRAFMKPWRFADDARRLELVFEPFFERITKEDFLVVRTEVHQMFGRYTGFAVADDGERIAIKGLIGWAEEHHALW